ncbi:LacI family DNA-binding transcriptional regulator [Temperatibacter marinus]|uniref:LacI family DNA-binding transcriptional regulator n=1 Tax=Temperatibacter marinus TaxID=1456591 RepID=A0AA52EDP8_9PROT|nr:LacI family DNA-binding transcriptional regulator [Temperatibacter marinus]WND03572.1 LacI family DNA-binding transcriptional regulator [Temperatibacter marinus]
MTSVSIKEVARVAGVSIATISRYLNDPDVVRPKTRQKVKSAILETGYTPNTLAQSFRRGKTNIIMVVLQSVGDPFFTNIMQGLQQAAKESGYTVMITEAQLDLMRDDELLAMMISKQVDGMILLATTPPFKDDPQHPSTLPVVVGCEAVSIDQFDFPSVHIDNKAAAEEATAFLISQGHSKISFMSGSPVSLLTADRETGYQQALEKAGLPHCENYVVSGDMTIEGARKATQDLLSLAEPPTAIFCANDEMALAAISTIKAHGLKVPEDISVMGFDDNRYAEICDPPLTTIYQPKAEIGRQSFRTLKALIDGQPDVQKMNVVPHQLVVRQSVKKH